METGSARHVEDHDTVVPRASHRIMAHAKSPVARETTKHSPVPGKSFEGANRIVHGASADVGKNRALRSLGPGLVKY
jgi:hypothetical protein